MQKIHPARKFYGIRPIASVGIAIAKDDPNSSRKYRRAEFKRNQKIQKAGN